MKTETQMEIDQENQVPKEETKIKEVLTSSVT